jgi:hypothetical protein
MSDITTWNLSATSVGAGTGSLREQPAATVTMTGAANAVRRRNADMPPS